MYFLQLKTEPAADSLKLCAEIACRAWPATFGVAAWAAGAPTTRPAAMATLQAMPLKRRLRFIFTPIFR